MNLAEIKISQKDWAIMPYNPFDAEFKDKSLTTKYDRLKRAFKYKMKPEVEKFLIITYTPNSPLKEMYQDPIERRKVAGVLCNFPINTETGYFEDFYNDIVSFKNSDFNKNAIAFIRTFDSSTLVHLVTLHEMYGRIQSELYSDETSDKKTAVELAKVKAEGLIKLNDIYLLIKETEKDFLGEESMEMKREIFRIVDEQINKLPISPENRLLNKQ
jgi:hypothetical protein